MKWPAMAGEMACSPHQEGLKMAWPDSLNLAAHSPRHNSRAPAVVRYLGQGHQNAPKEQGRGRRHSEKLLSTNQTKKAPQKTTHPNRKVHTNRMLQYFLPLLLLISQNTLSWICFGVWSEEGLGWVFIFSCLNSAPAQGRQLQLKETSES